MNNKILILAVSIIFHLSFVTGNDYTILSPDKSIKLLVVIGDKITYSVYYNGIILLKPSQVSLTIDQSVVLGQNPQVLKVNKTEVNEKLYPPIKVKRKEVTNHYNQLSMNFKNNFGLQFRVYDDGVAYRFNTRFKNDIMVYDEEASFNLAYDDTAYFPQITCDKNRDPEIDCFITSFEELYRVKKVSEIKNTEMAYVPVLIYSSYRPGILITEANLDDYPGMFLCGTENEGTVLKGKYAHYPLKFKTVGEYPQTVVTERASYIAKTKGTRDFPWRIILIAKTDGQLIESDIVYRLGGEQVQEDVSWLRPGKSQSEWLYDNNIYGVDFKSGGNTNTYKYYIDFASKFGMDYVLFDAGWSDPWDIFKLNPDMDMEVLANYAHEKGVGLVLWTSAYALDRQMELALDRFRQWGIKGIMVDFMNRDDQVTVNFYRRAAEETAKRQMFVDYHGAYKPDGLNRRYPNAITFEGAMGLEYYKFSDKNSPENEVVLLFTRLVAGPYDYEPGAMRNEIPENYRPIGNKLTSLGTRIHQMSLCVAYECPYSKLGGNVSDYLMEPEYTSFLVKIPTIWEETKVLKAKVADYAVIARKAENGDWYIGAVNDWTARDLEIDFSFLPDKKSFKIEIYQDGINADRYASDYKHIVSNILKTDKLRIHMAPGGGWVARISD
jgi:alpha-glucosidase